MTYDEAMKLKPGDLVVYTFPSLKQYHGSLGIVEGFRPIEDWENDKIPRPVIAWVSSPGGNHLAKKWNHRPFHENTLTRFVEVPDVGEI